MLDQESGAQLVVLKASFVEKGVASLINDLGKWHILIFLKMLNECLMILLLDELECSINYIFKLKLRFSRDLHLFKLNLSVAFGLGQLEIQVTLTAVCKLLVDLNLPSEQRP